MKGPKLPRYMWRKGMSKFLFPRMKQEGIAMIYWTGGGHDSALSQLHRKYINQVNLNPTK